MVARDSDVRIRLDGSIDPISLTTGARHRIRLLPARTTLLQALDLHFAHNRVIFLPGLDNCTEETQEFVTGIDVAAAALQFAHLNPKRLLVVGHASKVGSDAVNMTVSRARAENVYRYLSGPAEAWAAHCQENYEVDDLQYILNWAARAMTWPTMPGQLDNVMGQKTRGALKAFRRNYNLEFDASIPEDGSVSRDDWIAVYNVYDAVLEELSGDDEVGADEYRDSVSPLGDGFVGCGENWLREKCNVKGYPKGSDRRIDILFFDENEGAEVLLTEEPPGNSIYGLGRVEMDELPLTPQSFGSLAYEVWARISSHWLNIAVAGEKYVLVGPAPYRVVFREGATDDDGVLLERDLPVGHYEIEIAGAIIPVAAHPANHSPGGFSVPTDLRIHKLQAEQKPLHLSDEAIADEWIVPGPELGESPDEPDPELEDGAP